MKTILITGGCGFIASNFIKFLLKTEDYKIINVDRMDYCSSSKNITNNFDVNNGRMNHTDLNNYTFYKSNINNKEFISHILSFHGVDIVYHFAAQSHVDNSFNDSIEFINDNVVGTCNLLESCKQYGKLEKFIHVSTDEVYGQITENTPALFEGYYNPTNPYASSKACAELMAKSYLRSYNLPLIITRSNNVYGTNQYWEKIIPKFIRMIYNGKQCPVYGNGGALRKYLHVSDACNGFYKVLTDGKIGEVYEMDSNDEFSSLEILQQIVKIMKPNDDSSLWINHVPDRLFHDCRYLVNPTSMLKLGWNPVMNFNKGLEDTIKWYVDYAIPFDHWQN